MNPKKMRTPSRPIKARLKIKTGLIIDGQICRYNYISILSHLSFMRLLLYGFRHVPTWIFYNSTRKWVKVNVNCPELLLIGKTVLLVRLLKVTHFVTNCVWTFGSILSSSDVRSTLGPWSRRRDMDLNHLFDFVICCFFLLQLCEFSQSLYVAKVSYF